MTRVSLEKTTSNSEMSAERCPGPWGAGPGTRSRFGVGEVKCQAGLEAQRLTVPHGKGRVGTNPGFKMKHSDNRSSPAG